MKSILLLGLGRFGRHLARDLYEQGHEIMAVDASEDRIQDVLPYVTSPVIGDCSDLKLLSTLGVSSFDCCFVAIGSDFQASLITTSYLKDLGAKKIIARAARDVQAKLLSEIGADEIIYPERQIASWASIRYTSEHIFDYIELNKDYGIFEVAVPDSWLGHSIVEIDIRKKYNLNIMALKINDTLVMDISASTTFPEDSRILVLGRNKDIQKCFHI